MTIEAVIFIMGFVVAIALMNFIRSLVSFIVVLVVFFAFLWLIGFIK